MKNTFVAEIDGDELACRIAENCMGITRPEGKTAKQAMDQLRGEYPDIVAGWYLAAEAAAEYLAECMGNMERVQ